MRTHTHTHTEQAEAAGVQVFVSALGVCDQPCVYMFYTCVLPASVAGNTCSAAAASLCQIQPDFHYKVHPPTELVPGVCL